MSVDFSKVKGWAYLEEVFVNNIPKSGNSNDMLQAKMNEFEN